MIIFPDPVPPSNRETLYKYQCRSKNRNTEQCIVRTTLGMLNNLKKISWKDSILKKSRMYYHNEYPMSVSIPVPKVETQGFLTNCLQEPYATFRKESSVWPLKPAHSTPSGCQPRTALHTHQWMRIPERLVQMDIPGSSP